MRIFQNTFVAMIISLTLVFSKEWAPRVNRESSNSHFVSTETIPMAGVEALGIASTLSTSSELSHLSEHVAKRIKVRHSNHEDSRTVIPVHDFDFVTMHNILYFLYTGCVNLHFGAVPEQGLLGYPEEADSFDLFCAADFYCLQPLRDRCFRFLMETKTMDNVCPRLFNKRCEPYKELKEKYITFLLEHYDEISEKDDWKSLFNWGDELSGEAQKYRGDVLLEITRQLKFRKSV
jgi:hypothetical protein